MGERSYFDCDKDQSTWDWSLIIGRECWWDPEAQRLHLNTYCTHGFESELLEDHGYDPQSFPEVYITYGMNSWEDVGGSDLWVRDYLSEDPDLFAVYHAPNLKLRKQLDTPKDTWTYMGNFRNSEMLNKTTLGLIFRGRHPLPCNHFSCGCIITSSFGLTTPSPSPPQ